MHQVDPDCGRTGLDYAEGIMTEAECGRTRTKSEDAERRRPKRDRRYEEGDQKGIRQVFGGILVDFPTTELGTTQPVYIRSPIVGRSGAEDKHRERRTWRAGTNPRRGTELLGGPHNLIPNGDHGHRSSGGPGPIRPGVRNVPPGGWWGPPRRPTHLNKPYPDLDKLLMKAVQEVFSVLMRNYRHPSNEEVYAFDRSPHARPACTAQDFCPDYLSEVCSPWNKSVIKVLSSAVLQSRKPGIPANPTYTLCDRVHHYAMMRIKSWRRGMRRPTSASEKARKRRYERKRSMYFRRLQGAASNPETARHVQMIRDYGVEGMSSDESDHETTRGGHSVYRIRKKDWRHPDATDCLRAIDGLHLHGRFSLQDSHLVADLELEFIFVVDVRLCSRAREVPNHGFLSDTITLRGCEAIVGGQCYNPYLAPLTISPILTTSTRLRAKRMVIQPTQDRIPDFPLNDRF
ncbi:hypothetical protein NMY22_g14746 [Coprinellus aureogranulatus]|nr:hypothetical protein NMY22_g14746 [Coprinellus aureogranulatus]